MAPKSCDTASPILDDTKVLYSKDLSNGVRTKVSLSTPNSFHGLLHMAFCAFGICASYLYYGLLQEKLFDSKNSGSSHGGSLGPSFILFTQCLTNTAVAHIWQLIQQSTSSTSTPTLIAKAESHQQPPLRNWLLVLTSGCYVAAMACSNEAIQYVSYPVAVVAKSCKLIPTMVVSELLKSHKHSTLQWVAALLISGGMVFFQARRMMQAGWDSDSDSHQSSAAWWYGNILLSVSLLMDGFLSSCQYYLKHSSTIYRSPTAVETMFYVNAYALPFLFVSTYMNGQWTEGLERLFVVDDSDDGSHYSLWSSLLLLNSTVGVGQIFIFLTLAWYSPLITTTITTTRKFFTILLSVHTFGHIFDIWQWVAIMAVFGGLYGAIIAQHQQQKTKTS